MPTYIVELEDGRELEVEADTPPTSEDLTQYFAAQSAPQAQAAKKDLPFGDITDVASALGQAASSSLTTVPASFRQMYEGSMNPWEKSAESLESRKAMQRVAQESEAAQAEAEASGDASVMGRAIRSGIPSYGFTGAILPVSVAAGGVAGLGTGLVSKNPVAAQRAAMAAGSAASGVAAYRMAASQFMDDARERIDNFFLEKAGRLPNKQEQDEAYQELLPLAQEMGMAEALPEAFGNLALAGAGKYIYRILGGKTGVQQLASGALSKARGLNAAKALGAGAASTGVEVGTEGLTEMLNEDTMKKLEEGVMRGEDVSTVQTEPYSMKRLGESIEKVAEPTLATTAIMGLLGAGGGMAYRAATKQNLTESDFRNKMEKQLQASQIGLADPEATAANKSIYGEKAEEAAAALKALDEGRTSDVEKFFNVRFKPSETIAEEPSMLDPVEVASSLNTVSVQDLANANSPLAAKSQDDFNQAAAKVLPPTEPAVPPVKTAEAVEPEVTLNRVEQINSQKQNLDQKAQQLGFANARALNLAKLTSTEVSDQEREVLEEYGNLNKDIKELSWKDAVNLPESDFDVWSKTRFTPEIKSDVDLNGMGQLYLTLSGRGEAEKATQVLQKIQSSKRKANWTVAEWSQRFPDDATSQEELNSLNQQNQEWNDGIDSMLSILQEKTSPEVTPSLPETELAVVDQGAPAGTPIQAATISNQFPGITAMAAEAAANLRGGGRISPGLKAAIPQQTPQENALPVEISDESLLREERPEMELPGVGKQDAQPKEVAAEGREEKVITPKGTPTLATEGTPTSRDVGISASKTYKGKAKKEYEAGIANGEKTAFQSTGVSEDAISSMEWEDMRKDVLAASRPADDLIRVYRHGKTQGRVNRLAPVYAAAVDSYGITLPEGYGPNEAGDLYVFQPKEFTSGGKQPLQTGSGTGTTRQLQAGKERGETKALESEGISASAGEYFTEDEARTGFQIAVGTLDKGAVAPDSPAILISEKLSKDSYAVKAIYGFPNSVRGVLTQIHLGLPVSVEGDNTPRAFQIASEAPKFFPLAKNYTRQGDLYVFQPGATGEPVQAAPPAAQAVKATAPGPVSKNRIIKHWVSKAVPGKPGRYTSEAETIDYDALPIPSQPLWVKGNDITQLFPKVNEAANMAASVDQAFQEAMAFGGKGAERKSLPGQPGELQILVGEKPKSRKAKSPSFTSALVKKVKIGDTIQAPISDYSNRSIVIEDEDGNMRALGIGSRSGSGGMVALGDINNHPLLWGKPIPEGTRRVYTFDWDSVNGNLIHIYDVKPSPQTTKVATQTETAAPSAKGAAVASVGSNLAGGRSSELQPSETQETQPSTKESKAAAKEDRDRESEEIKDGQKVRRARKSVIDPAKTNIKYGKVTTAIVEAARRQLQNSGEIPNAILTRIYASPEAFLADRSNQRYFPAAYARIMAEPNVEGLYADKTTFVFASNVGVSDLDRGIAKARGISEEQAAARRVIAHENGHRGVDLFEPWELREFRSFVNRTYTTEEIDNLVRLYTEFSDWRTNPVSRNEALEEIFQKKFERLVKIPTEGIWDDIVQFLKRVWRRLTGRTDDPTLDNMKDVVRLLRNAMRRTAVPSFTLNNGGEVKLSITDNSVANIEKIQPFSIKTSKRGFSTETEIRIGSKSVSVFRDPENGYWYFADKGGLGDMIAMNKQDAIKAAVERIEEELGGPQPSTEVQFHDWKQDKTITLPGFFIRFGDVPKEGKSKKGHMPGLFEKGVSVLKAWKSPDGVFVISSVTAETGATDLVSGLEDRPVYIAYGEDTGEVGSDGEPLLKEVILTEQLINNRIVVDDPTYIDQPITNNIEGQPWETISPKPDPFSSPDIRFSRVEYASDFSAASSAGAQLARDTVYDDRIIEMRDAIRRAYERSNTEAGVAMPLDELYAKAKELAPEMTENEFGNILQDLYEDNGAVLQEGATQISGEPLASTQNLEKDNPFNELIRKSSSKSPSIGEINSVSKKFITRFIRPDSSFARQNDIRIDGNATLQARALPDGGIVIGYSLSQDSFDGLQKMAPQAASQYTKDAAIEELIHLSDLIGLKNQWLKSGKKIPFDQFVLNEQSNLAFSLIQQADSMSDSEAESLRKILASSLSLYDNNADIAKLGLNELLDLAAQNSFVLPELIRSLIQLKKTGQITETAFRKIANVLRQWQETVLQWLIDGYSSARDGVFGEMLSERIKNAEANLEILSGNTFDVFTPEGRRAGFAVIMPKRAVASRVEMEGEAVKSYQDGLEAIESNSLNAFSKARPMEGADAEIYTVKPSKFYKQVANDFVNKLIDEGNSIESIGESLFSKDFLQEIGIKNNMPALVMLVAVVKDRVSKQSRDTSDGDTGNLRRVILQKLDRRLAGYWQNLGTNSGRAQGIRSYITTSPEFSWMFIFDRANENLEKEGKLAATRVASDLPQTADNLQKTDAKAGEDAGEQVADDLEDNQDAIDLAEGEATLDQKGKTLWEKFKDLIRKRGIAMRALNALRAGNKAKASISSEERNTISQMSEEELIKFIAGIDKEMAGVFDEFTKTPATRKKREKMVATAKKRAEQGKSIEPSQSSAKEKLSGAERTAQNILKDLSERYADPNIYTDAKRAKINEMRELYKKRVRQGVGPEQMSEQDFVSKAVSLGANKLTAETLWKAAELEIEAREAIRQEEVLGKLTLEKIQREISALRPGEQAPFSKTIPWRKLLSQKAATVKIYRQRIFDTISSEESFSDLDDAQKAKLADLLTQAWESKREAILDGMVKNVINQEQAAGRLTREGADALRSQRQKLVEDINLGILDEDRLMKHLADKFGIKSEFTEAERANIDRLLDILQDDKLNEVKRNKAGYELLEALSASTKIPFVKWLADLWVTAVLSGLNTAASIAMAVANGGFELTVGAFRVLRAGFTNPKEVPAEIEASFKAMAEFLKAFGREGRLAWQYLVTGDRALLDPSLHNVRNDLNYDSIGKTVSLAERMAKSDKVLEKVMGIWMRSVSRLLTALDNFNTGVTKAGALPIVFRQLNLSGEDLQRAAEKYNLKLYREKAIQEDFNNKQPTNQHEKALVDSYAKARMMADLQEFGKFSENADFIAQNGAMTLDPTGVGGAIYSGIKYFTGGATTKADKFLADAQREWNQVDGADKTAKGLQLAFAYIRQFIAYNSANLAGLRFARFAGNKFNQGLSFIPGIGMFRMYEATVKDSKIEAKEAFTDMILRNQTAGLLFAIIGGMALKAITDEPDDEKRGFFWNGGWANLTPDRKQQKLAAGQKEYTIGIPGVIAFNYQNWPISPIMAAIGSLSDLIRFSPEQWNEKAMADRIVSAAASGVFSAAEIPALSGFQTLFGNNLSSKDPNEKRLDRFAKVMAGWGGGFVPRILKDIDFMADPGLRKYESLWEQTASHIPVYRRYSGEEYYDILGKQIERKVWPGSREFMELETDPEYRTLGKLNSRGIWLTPANAEHRMVGKGRNKRKLTQEEADAYSLETGKGYRQMLLRYGSRLEQMPTERARAFLMDKADEVRDRALKKIVR